MSKLFLIAILFLAACLAQQQFSRKYPKPFAKVMDFDFEPKFQYIGEYKPVLLYGKKVSEDVRKSDLKSGYLIEEEKQPIPLPNTVTNRRWNILKYDDGVFVKHTDKIQSHYHIGTEILIFPKSMSPHSQGHLIIYDGEDESKWMEVHAQEHVYTYVYIPLNYLHEVTQVKGVRTVATRRVDTDTLQEIVKLGVANVKIPNEKTPNAKTSNVKAPNRKTKPRKPIKQKKR